MFPAKETMFFCATAVTNRYILFSVMTNEGMTVIAIRNWVIVIVVVTPVTIYKDNCANTNNKVVPAFGLVLYNLK